MILLTFNQLQPQNSTKNARNVLDTNIKEKFEIVKTKHSFWNEVITTVNETKTEDKGRYEKLVAHSVNEHTFHNDEVWDTYYTYVQRSYFARVKYIRRNGIEYFSDWNIVGTNEVKISERVHNY